MAINETVKVPTPPRTVGIKNGEVYYAYYTIKTYRTKNGSIKNDRICIGKFVDNSKKQIYPNSNYYSLFDYVPPELSDSSALTRCGTYAVCKNIAENTGLTSILKQVFPDDFGYILTCAHYMITSGSVMYYLEDWNEETRSFSNKTLNDVSVGRLFKDITEKDKNSFFEMWMKLKAENDFIAYDVTSISSYSHSLEDAEYGYNRDKEKLPQINFGMYYCEKSKTPVYYKIYPGSITDKVHCTYMIDGTTDLNFKGIYFVMDKGFYSEDNLKHIIGRGHRFIITMPPSLNLYKKLVDENKADIINNIDYKLKDKLIYCKEVELHEYGFRSRAHIFYNQAKSTDNAEALYKKLSDMKKELEKMTTAPSAGSSYYDYYNITEKNGYLVFEEKKEAIKKALERCGFFIILETVFDKNSDELLEIYAERDSIEKSFDDLKNEIDLSRLRCSTNETVNGKAFVAFIGLIMISKMRQYLSEYASNNKCTLKKVLLELDKIKARYVRKEQKYKLANPLTKKQKDILESMRMTEEIFDHI